MEMLFFAEETSTGNVPTTSTEPTPTPTEPTPTPTEPTPTPTEPRTTLPSGIGEGKPEPRTLLINRSDVL